MLGLTMDPSTFEANATRVAAILGELANPRRLMVLCRLAEHGELRVGDLADSVGLSQSALSQHLARLRDQSLVAPRRESQTVWYRIADERVGALLAALYELYCQEGTEG